MGWWQWVIMAIQTAVSLGSATAKKTAYESAAKGYRYEARQHELRGEQIGAEYKQELEGTLATIEALRTARGLGGRGDTARSIFRDEKYRSATAANAAILSEKQAASIKRFKASQLKKAGVYAAIDGFAQTLGSMNSMGGMGGMSGGGGGGSGGGGGGGGGGAAA